MLAEQRAAPLSRLLASRGSRPAIASSSRAQSSAVLASGPTVSSDGDIGNTPYRLTSPNVGFRPTTPLTEAGTRIDPPVSVPIAAKAEPTATDTPDPALEPPGYRRRSHGLRVTGTSWPYANSCVTVFPTMTAPA